MIHYLQHRLSYLSLMHVLANNPKSKEYWATALAEVEEQLQTVRNREEPRRPVGKVANRDI